MRWVFEFSGCLLAALLQGNDALPPAFWATEPLPALLEAGSAALAEAGWDRALEVPAVTYLVEEREDGEISRQWLLRFALLPSAETGETPETVSMHLYTSTGREHIFTDARIELAIDLYGPVRVTRRKPEGDLRKAELRRTRSVVNGSYFKLGFDQTFAASARLRAVREEISEEQNIPFRASSEPFPPAVTGEGRAFAERIGFSAADERSLVGSAPAVLSFFRVAADTPEVSDLMWEMMDVSVWTLVGNLGRFPAVNINHLKMAGPLDAVPAVDRSELPETPLFEGGFGIDLDGESRMLLRLAAIAPEAALQAGAGIVAFAASRPEGDGPQLMVRVLLPESDHPARAGEEALPSE
jgi:hypothetical protein